MTKLIKFNISILLLFLFGTNYTLSDVPESQKPEVQHLLEFVDTSECMFERNGKKHDAKDASKHIKRKYKHYRNKITTTEEFIEYSGSKSTMSGKEYLIYCSDNDPVKSQEWLLEELSVYRTNSKEI